MKKNTPLCVSVLLSFTVGCSCFVSSHQTFKVKVSEPEHAKVWVNDSYQGEAPVEVSVLRDENVYVTVKKEGYQTYRHVVLSDLSTTGVLDILGTCIFLIPVIGVTSPGAHSLSEPTLFLALTPEENHTSSTNTPAPATK